MRRVHCSFADVSDQNMAMGMQERKSERMHAAKVMAQMPCVIRRYSVIPRVCRANRSYKNSSENFTRKILAPSATTQHTESRTRRSIPDKIHNLKCQTQLQAHDNLRPASHLLLIAKLPNKRKAADPQVVHLHHNHLVRYQKERRQTRAHVVQQKLRLCSPS